MKVFFLKLYGGTHGSSGTFRMDDFVLNGFVREENSGYSSSDYFVSRNHRYSFQNQEHHDEIRGKGNYINYKYRGYDPRVGRLDWLVDPLAPSYPWNSPYAFSENVVINAVELEGLEKVSIYDVYSDNGLTKYKLTKSYIDKDVKNGVDRSIYNYLDEKGGNIINTEEVRSWRSNRYPELNMYDSEIKSNWEEGKYFDAFIWRVKKIDDAVKGDVMLVRD